MPMSPTWRRGLGSRCSGARLKASSGRAGRNEMREENGMQDRGSTEEGSLAVPLGRVAEESGREVFWKPLAGEGEGSRLLIEGGPGTRASETQGALRTLVAGALKASPDLLAVRALDPAGGFGVGPSFAREALREPGALSDGDRGGTGASADAPGIRSAYDERAGTLSAAVGPDDSWAALRDLAEGVERRRQELAEESGRAGKPIGNWAALRSSQRARGEEAPPYVLAAIDRPSRVGRRKGWWDESPDADGLLVELLGGAGPTTGLIVAVSAGSAWYAAEFEALLGFSARGVYWWPEWWRDPYYEGWRRDLPFEGGEALEVEPRRTAHRVAARLAGEPVRGRRGRGRSRRA